MLPGTGESYGRFVPVTSAAVPRNIAPSSKLTFDPSLTHLIAAAAAKSTSRYQEPASWPDVFVPGSSPGASPLPAPGSSPGGDPPSPSVPAVPSAPVTPPVQPSGDFGSGGGWAPSPVVLPPSGGGAGSVPVPTAAPELPADIMSPPGEPALPEGPVVVSAAPIDAPIDARVPEGGTTFLLLGVPVVLVAVLRKHLRRSSRCGYAPPSRFVG